MVAKGSRDRRSSSSANAASTSTKQRVSSASHDKKKIAKPIGICGFCLGNNKKNANGIPEEMINCAECGNSGHPSCLQYSEKLVEKIRTIRWQCIDCKQCIVCHISDDLLLFCDLCDSGVHPKCCDPPLNTIPKGDFVCHACRDETKLSPKKSLVKTLSSTRSHRSNDDDSSPVAQPTDEISNFFLPNKPKPNHLRQQSVQKAMKYLRDKKIHKSSNKKLLKRLHSTDIHPKENQLLEKTILASSKTSRMKKHLLNDDLPSKSSPQTSTPLLNRHSSKNKFEPMTPTPRVSRRSDVHLNEELNKTISSRSTTKRKHSANSISPISSTSSIIIKKRARNESPLKKHQSKNKQKEFQTDDEQSDDDEHMKRKIHLDLSKYKNPPAFLNDALPNNITENDIYLFLESRKNSTKLLTDCSEKFHHSSECIDDDSTNTRWPPYIVFGSDLIKTWYSSSYPQEYARVPRLYICEFCLKYMKCEEVYDRHRKKCTVFHPPANEIYHRDDLSVFEVDGNINRIYCQNLCLLAKLFLDHKTLYYDVEPFLFYVLTKNDSNGCHFLGYFSKEKHCPQKYNLSCITVLPRCQRRGYGRFLIEFSYLLSQKEGQVGTPERPLSTLGAQTYEAYWNIKIVEQLIIYYHENKEKCLLKTIMNETGMAVDDIIETLQNLGVLTMKSNGKPVITADITQLETILKNERIKHAHWVSIDSEYLRFTPVMTPLLLINEEKAVEKQVKEIQIVFKAIDREAAEAAASLTADDSNPTEGVRYIRRRKFGQKRRSILVKRRAPIHKQSLKNQSMITNEDDEHSQEYVPRRRISTINESIKEEREEEKEENQTIPLSLSPKVSLKQQIFKQLKLDQFLKIFQPSTTTSNEETSQTNLSHSELNNDDSNTQTRRITRHTRLHSTSKSETDPIKIENEISSEIVNHQESKSDEGISTASSNDSSTTTTTNNLHSLSISNMDRPIPLKRRSLTSTNIQALIDEACSPPKNKTDQPTILNHETSTTSSKNPPETPSSTLSDILANPLLTSINGIEDETKIACIESQLTTTTSDLINNDQDKKEILSVKPVQPIDDDDESPPSLTSPTSMIISQSNHYNYSTRSKQQQQQQINHCTPSTNTNYNFDNTSYPYPSSCNMPPCYYPSTTTMDYMPYYPSTGSMYDDPSAPQLYYSSNDVNSISYNGNGTTPLVQSSSTAPTTQGN